MRNFELNLTIIKVHLEQSKKSQLIKYQSSTLPDLIKHPKHISLIFKNLHNPSIFSYQQHLKKSIQSFCGNNVRILVKYRTSKCLIRKNIEKLSIKDLQKYSKAKHSNKIAFFYLQFRKAKSITKRQRCSKMSRDQNLDIFSSKQTFQSQYLIIKCSVSCLHLFSTRILNISKSTFALLSFILIIFIMLPYTIKHQKDLIPPEIIAGYSKYGFSRLTCESLHPLSCNQFCFNYVGSAWLRTYKTYGTVYLVSLLFRYKKMMKNPLYETAKFIVEYFRSSSLTPVQMMLMRRILCFLCNYTGNKAINLMIANFFSALYLLIETAGRQPQIALYQLTNTSRVIYHLLKRRGYVKPIPGGQCLMMGLALGLISYFFYDCQEAFRRTYILSIFKKILQE